MPNPFEELKARIVALESQQMQTMRLGYVTQIYEDEGKVRVECQDADVVETFKLPVLCHKTRCDKDYWMPDEGEHVLCIFLPVGQEKGFVLGSFYSEKDLVPVASRDKAHIRFLDGTWIEYDRGTGELQVHCRGKIVLAAAEKIQLKAPVLEMPNFQIKPGLPEIKPVEPSPIPPPMEWPYA